MTTSDWILKEGFYKYGQYAYEFLNKSKINLLKEGYWNIRVIVEYKDENGQIKENALLTYTFFVLGYSDKSKKMLLREWTLSSACLVKPSKLLKLEHIKLCKTDAPWSSFYPDPKSDFMYGMKSENRDLEE